MTVRAIVSYLVVVFVVFGVSACNRGEQGVEAANEAWSPEASEFSRNATQTHLAEINMAGIAKTQSQNEEVRDYAEMLIDDHRNAFEKLDNLMKEHGDMEARTLEAGTKQEIERMRGLSGLEFDREYLNMMVEGHKKALAMVQQAAASAMNPDVQDYAEDLVPTIEKHLQRAQELQSEVFGGARP
jgi:putative membrane protein